MTAVSQTLAYESARRRRLAEEAELPIGQLGLYYTILGMAVSVVYAAIVPFEHGAIILLPFAVLFWATGAIVSLVGTFRLSGRRCAVAGIGLSILGMIALLPFML